MKLLTDFCIAQKILLQFHRIIRIVKHTFLQKYVNNEKRIFGEVVRKEDIFCLSFGQPDPILETASLRNVEGKTMRTFTRPFVFVIILIAALATPMAVAAQENPPPSVPAFDGCDWIGQMAGHLVCLNGHGMNVTSVQGNFATFTHEAMPWGEGAVSVSVVNDDGFGASEVQIMGTAVNVLFYSTGTTAYHDQFGTDGGNAVVTLQNVGATVFYVGALGAPGDTLTLMFGVYGPDVPRGPIIDSTPYVWRF